jgi:23S rRNA pseudouridine1911/1915/1917 synthase
MDEVLKIVFEIDEKRIDSALTKELMEKGITRSHIQKLIVQEKIFLNGKKPKASDSVSRGDVALIHLIAPDTSEPLPLDFPLKIVHEDEDLFVIEKPAGMVTHPAHGHFNDTLVNVLLSLGRPLSQFQGKERAGIVHRLDKETSGLMVIAKNEIAHSFLSKQFADRKVEKEYNALIWGTLPKDNVTVEGNIGRDPRNRQKYAVRREGKAAATFFKEIERMKHISLVLARPQSGRTHQIRVHLAFLHHSIVGDSLYGGHQEKGIPEIRLREAVRTSGRFFLHATKLAFDDRKGKRIEVRSSLPLEFLELMEIFKTNG